MRWEVPIMASKRSCFNRTLMCRDLQRFWPCWAATLLTALLLLPVNMVSILNARLQENRVLDITDSAWLVVNCQQVVLIAAAGLGILVAVLVSRHLFTSRATNFYHALPIRREGLLLTNIATGIVMLWVPILLTALVTMAVELSYGIFDPVSLGQLLLFYLCSSLLFFSMGLLCCHVTGMVVSAVGLYVALNFVFMVGYGFFTALLESFVLGYTSGTDGQAVRFLTPFVNLLTRCGRTELPYGGEDYALARLMNMDLPLLYAGVAVAILAVTLLLYRCRKSERAGDLLAFGWLRPVFKVCCALLAGTGLCLLTMEMYNLYHYGLWAVVSLVVLWSLVAWMVAEMLVRKSIRVFKKPAFLQWGVTALCAVLLLVGMQLDVFGIERHVPAPEEVSSVQLSINGRYVSLSDPAPVLALHEQIVESRDVLRSVRYDDDVRTVGVRIDYNTADGVLERYYQIPTAETVDEMTALQRSVYDILTDPEMVMGFYFDGPLEYKSELKTVAVEYYDTEEDVNRSLDLTTDEAWALYQAIAADIAAGNLDFVEEFCWDEYEQRYFEGVYDNLYIEFNYIHRAVEQQAIAEADGRPGSIGWQWTRFTVYSGMTNTLAVLKDLGWEP